MAKKKTKDGAFFVVSDDGDINNYASLKEAMADAQPDDFVFQGKCLGEVVETSTRSLKPYKW